MQIILENEELKVTINRFGAELAGIFGKKQQREYLTVTFDMPLFGVWSPAGKHAPFICIEPWCGRCDRAEFEGTLEEREYGECLKTGETFRQEYGITVS